MPDNANPFRAAGQPQEPTEARRMSSNRTVRSFQVHMPDGTQREYIQDENFSAPTGDDIYSDFDTRHVYIDPTGNPVNISDPSQFWVSHSGLEITSPTEKANCASRFHPRGLPTNIKVGFDGVRLPDGRGICSRCQFWRTNVGIAICLAAAGVVIGIYRGLGWF